jgi:hypothetical protein
MKVITESLLENSKSAIIGCVELHNKPVFKFRYEICTILAINGWELLLKAYINEHHPDIKLIRKDGTSKSFEECLSYLSSQLGAEFRAEQENLEKLYEFRCHIIHFYKDHIGTILYSLLHKSIIFYNRFLQKHFNIDLAEETNLMLLPIGFKPFSTPVDFLTKQSDLKESSNAVQTFIKSIISSTEKLDSEGIEESILTGYNVAVINENRIKNADIIAGITKNKSDSKLTVSNVLGAIQITNDEVAKKVNIEEETLFKTVYTMKYLDVVKQAKEMFSDFKRNAKFNQVMKGIKENPSLHRKRYLDFVNKSGIGQDFYNPEVLNELKNHYTLKEK